MTFSYALIDFPMRNTIESHLYCFERFSRHRVFYLNLFVRRIPRWLRELEFDLIVFDTTLLGSRWTPHEWRTATDRALSLPRREEVRVAIPQDEFLRPRWVSEFVQSAEVDIACSVAPKTEWPKFYPDLVRRSIRFHKVLTGYLDEDTAERVETSIVPRTPRTVDIGYRARPSLPRGSDGTVNSSTRSARSFAPPRSLAA